MKRISEYLINNDIKVHRLKFGIYQSYLIKIRGSYLLVDTVRKSLYSKLRKSILKVIGDPSKLKYLILTHTHFDHCENARCIKDEFCVKIIVHQSEADYLRSGFSPLPRGTYFITDFLSSIGSRYLRKYFSFDAVNPDILINRKMELSEYGPNIITLLHTPGHSKGSLSIIIQNKIILTGDNLINLYRKSVFPPYSDDISTMLTSWKNLLDLESDLYLPGHGKAISKELLKRNYVRYRSIFLI